MFKNKFIIQVKDKPKKSENAIIQKHVLDFNDSKLGKIYNFSVFIKDKNYEIQGGIILQLRLNLQLLYIDYIWIALKLRNKGAGTKLIKIAERIALNKGCNIAKLETLSFQAEMFYLKLGYIRFGIIKQYMGDFDYIFMKKSLN